MFEDMTYERLLTDVLGNAPDGVDTRQGSIFYDAVSGVLIKIAKLYSDLDMIVDLTRGRAGRKSGRIRHYTPVRHKSQVPCYV